MIIFILFGILISAFMVLLARFVYLYFFQDQCLSQQCWFDLPFELMIMYGLVILIGGFNAYLYKKHDKAYLLFWDALGTFLFCIALNFIYRWWLNM
ncbi:hypothetical protein [Acinetobacter shaoyimingii]|uniref:Uncharacterized protein n=1 Tax=Acinetobacter shaoyimingii TaxID=2715164 RepID=A0A6G8RW34_9GAMM|nr:hypothetical protein [Acinetobacter shaoyimingii]QIO05933.1 hypothetical protein G8E00_08215 [Acinetobacter shaoyimingii]